MTLKRLSSKAHSGLFLDFSFYDLTLLPLFRSGEMPSFVSQISHGDSTMVFVSCCFVVLQGSR